MFCFDVNKRVLYSPFVYLLDQLRGSCDIFGGQCGPKEARMAEQHILHMEEGQIQREMPILRPYDMVEYRGVQQSPAPTRSIVDIPKFSGQDNENITYWMEHWNRAVLANGWSVHTELVMFPLFLVGRALQHFRTVPSEVKESVYELKREFERHFNSPWQHLQAKNLLGERSQKPNESVAEYYEDVCCLVQRAWGTKSIEYQREKSLDYFVKGLKQTIRKIFWGEEPDNLDVAYERARTREMYLLSKKGKYEVRAVDSERMRAVQNESPTAHGENEDMKELLSSMRLMLQNQQALISLQQETLNRFCEFKQEENAQGVRPKARVEIVCWKCGEMGHFQSKCRKSVRQGHPLEKRQDPPVAGKED